MKVKVAGKVYDGDEQPIMIILNDVEKQQITDMHPACTKYCVYPAGPHWTENDYKNIKEWMREI